MGDHGTVLGLGGDDPQITREIIVAMYAFLVHKPINTRRAYRAGIRQFLDLFNWPDLRSVTPHDAANYKQWLIDRGYSKSTICTRLAAVDAFFAFLTHAADGRLTIDRNPFDDIDRKDVLPTVAEQATPVAWSDFEKMMKATPADPIGIRDQAVLVFLAYTGRGRSEVARLRVGDLRTRSIPRSYRVTTNGQEKSFELPDEVYAAIRAHWISADRTKRLGPDSAVFGDVVPCSLTADLDPERPLHHNAIAVIVKRAAVRAGLDPKTVKIHSLRHMTQRKAGTGLHDVERFLSQTWPNTSRYLEQLRDPAPALAEEMKRVRAAAVKVAEPIVDR